MKKIEITEKMLMYIYVILSIIAIWLNLASSSFEWKNFAITVVMFIIVGIVFLYAYKKLGIVIKITKELKDATESIKQAFDVQKKYLWAFYKQSKENMLFQDGYLAEHYKNYCDEVERLEEEIEIGYKCDIEDYINQKLIEDYLKKNMLSIVPSTMTGLGILGTFIGLSIGLQDFATGSADEIILGITTLMDGIKIAFHTSIFGMAFSLAFNYIYKSILEEALGELDLFLDEFRRKVTPDSQNENEKTILNVMNNQSDTIIKAEEKLERELIEYLKFFGQHMNEMKTYQTKQNQLLEELSTHIANNIVKGVSESIRNSLLPQFEKLDQTLNNFVFDITESQNVALEHMVDKFIIKLNSSVENNFKNLSNIIENTCDMQEENNKYTQEVLKIINETILDIEKIEIVSTKTIENFASYIELIEKLQEAINENFINVNVQLNENNQISNKLMGYVDKLVEYERCISKTTNSFTEDMSKQVEILEQISGEISNSSQENLRILAEKAEKYNETLANAAKQQMSGIEDICNQISKGCHDNLFILSENAKASNIEIQNAAKQKIQDIIQTSSNIGDEFNEASSNLARTAGQLNSELEKSLNVALEKFDDKLAFILEGLGKMIQEIDNTTERVPKVVANTYDQMYKIFENLNNEMKKMTIGIQPITDDSNLLQNEIENNEIENGEL